MFRVSGEARKRNTSATSTLVPSGSELVPAALAVTNARHKHVFSVCGAGFS